MKNPFKRAVGFSKSEAPQENIVTLADAPSIDFSTLLDRYNVVEVANDNGNAYIVVTEKTNSNTEWYENNTSYLHEPTAQARALGANVRDLPASVRSQRVKLDDLAGTGTGYVGGQTAVNLNEIGSSSPSPFVSFVRRDYNPDLIGLRGLQNYDKMRRNDGTVKGTLRSVKTPVLSARWFMEPKDKDKVADVNATNWIWDNLTRDMSIGWTQVLTEALLMCDFGYYMFEIVWEETRDDRGNDRLKIKKLAPRHPMDVASWDYDANGGVDGAWFYTDDPTRLAFIPIDKLLVFTFDREAGDMTGISMLRSAYKHWYFVEQLYKIDAIQKERHGIGVPIIELPPSFSEADKQIANEIGRNLRTNERAHVVLPPFWKIYFAKLEGNVVNALESIKEHKEAIRENILLQFMDTSSTTSEEDQMMFLKATRFIADIICDTFNSYLIPRIVEANFNRVGVPVLKARRIGESGDWRTLSFAVRNLIGCGALQPDDKLEAWLRDEMDMPELDKDTVREVVNLQIRENIDNTSGTPDQNPQQDGQKAGLPRQAKTPSAPGMKKDAGSDGSGG